MNYTEKTLHSGKEVHIRPLTWTEFWDFNIDRADAATQKSDNAAELLKASRDIREKTLAACVKDWATLKESVSLPDVLEMERIIDDISKAPVLEGNSLPIGDTTPTRLN